MANKTSLKPGLNVNIIVAIENGIIDVRTGVIYDIIGKDIILSQTSRPIGPKRIGKNVSVTYLAKEDGRQARHGFEGKVADIIKEYELNSSTTVPAILVKRRTDIQKYDLRMFYRVKPNLEDTALTLHLAEKQVTIVDISLGGVLFSHTSDHPTEAGKIQKISLSIDGQSFQMDGNIVSAWYPSDARGHTNLEYVKLQFPAMDIHCEHLLNKKIFAIEREYLSNLH